ncbi:hypothetical protein FGIG_07760 [Fasciola gigantica]|uniref:Uncharacterized protein n=1 Tax=Fasciola gigantica TaxID=46835 RepID=A0A504Z3N8_FASGI|nr:hypothetical protein FGIG_07760 [Fasciola gigantica]
MFILLVQSHSCHCRLFQNVLKKLVLTRLPAIGSRFGRLIRCSLLTLIAAACRLCTTMLTKFRRHTVTVNACCPDPLASHTGDGFEWSIQQNYLAQVFLVQCLFGCFGRVSPDERAARIILMSEEIHRGHLPLLDASVGTVPWQFTHTPTNLIDWLDQYRWSKQFQLLYLFELQRRIGLRSSEFPGRLGPVPILCACAQGSPLIGCCPTRWRAIRAPLWMRAFLCLFWLIGSMLGQALDQVAATPVLCAVDDSLNVWKLTETDPRRRISRALRPILYVQQCRPRSTLLKRFEASCLLRTSSALWEVTEAALSPYLGDRSIWQEFFGQNVGGR